MENRPVDTAGKESVGQIERVELVAKNPPFSAGHMRHEGSTPGREGALEEGIAVPLPGEAHGQRSLAGYSLWGHEESDTTEAT